MKYHFEIGRKKFDLFANRMKYGYGLGVQMYRWIFKIGLGLFVLGVEMTTRGNCENCCFHYWDRETNDTRCINPDSEFYNEETDPNFSCEKWGI